MTYRSIALMGVARSGKDTVAKRLGSEYQFTRVAFADPVREMALEIDPIILGKEDRLDWDPEPLRLSEIVRTGGWELAKDEYPEVRRILQHVGQTPRNYRPSFWLDIAATKIAAAKVWNMPVVITDCRYQNEADFLRAAGFLMVRVERPGAGLAGQQHESETALANYQQDRTILNNGTLDDLAREADRLVEYL